MTWSKPPSQVLKPLTGVGSHNILGLARDSWREGRSSHRSESAHAVNQAQFYYMSTQGPPAATCSRWSFVWFLIAFSAG